MSSTDSDDISDDNYQYWNWQTPDDQVNFNADVNRKKPSRFKTLEIPNKVRCRKKIQNWIPPSFFLETDKLGNLNSTRFVNNEKQNEIDILKDKNVSFNEEENLKKVMDRIASDYNIFDIEKLLNINWGKRIELNDVMEYMDGNLIWGVVNLGVFDVINLRINEYGYICALAEATISKIGFPETTKISITDIHLLQKMLGLSHSQWTSLCEAVQQNRQNLKFNAYNMVDLEKMTSLEKLWFFICKRRHCLPDQCMLLKFNGVEKSLKEFKIIPKLIVQDIKNIRDGELN